MISYYSSKKVSDVVEEIVFPTPWSCTCEYSDFAVLGVDKEIQAV
jgi:hypothetical protein